MIQTRTATAFACLGAFAVLAGAQQASPVALSEPLEDLSFLVGHWQAREGGDGSTTYVRAEPALRGTHLIVRIGESVEPGEEHSLWLFRIEYETGQPMAMVFSADDPEMMRADWSFEDGSLLLESEPRELPSGQTATASYRATPDGDDAIEVEVEVTVDGEIIQQTDERWTRRK